MNNSIKSILSDDIIQQIEEAEIRNKNREDSHWSVYIHVIPKNISGHNNSLYYVGITQFLPTERWGSSGNRYATQPFSYAIQQYGWENIEHYVISSSLLQHEALLFENLIISYLQSYKSEYGYNRRYNSSPDNSYSVPTEDIRVQISNTTSYKENHYYHKHHTDDVRKKISNNHADFNNENHPQCRSVIQYDLDMHYIAKYPTIRDAAKQFAGSSYATISMCCNNKIKTAYGYIWRYAENYKPRFSGILQLSKEGVPIAIYTYIKDAAKKYDIHPSCISKCCTGKHRTAAGFKWKYLTDVDESEITDSFLLQKYHNIIDKK